MFGRLVTRVVGPSVLVAAGLVGISVPAAHAVGDPPAWYGGAIEYSAVIDCGSIIWGNPYTSKGVGVWVGAVADLDESQPGIDQTFYVRVIVGGIGNACSGTGFRPGFTLPAGLARDTTQPIRCFINGSQTMNAADCPQTSGSIATNYFGAGSFAYISGRTQDGNLWPAAPGATWEFQFPVKSSTLQNMATLQGHVQVADGNANPTLHPKVGFNVFPASAAPTPSAGLDSASTSENLSLPVNNSRPGWKLFTDWDPVDGFSPLVAGRRYYWQVGFTPTGGSIHWGAKQTFDALTHATCQGLPVTVSLALGQTPTEGDDVILGTPGADTINALGGADTICALGGNDVIDGGSGDDTVDAGDGDDLIVPREGNDITIGGSGADTVSYYGSPSGVSFALGFGLDLQSQNTGGAGFDAETGVENLTGTEHADVLRGSNVANRLVGGPGDDTLPGAGNDTVDGMGPLLGAAPGRDTISYTDQPASRPVTVDLRRTTAQNTGGAGINTISRVLHRCRPATPRPGRGRR